MALFASMLLNGMAKTKALTRHGYFRNDCMNMAQLAADFEKYAIEVINRCYREDTTRARQVLKHPLHHFPGFEEYTLWSDSMKLAASGGCLDFVVRPVFQEQMERDWCETLF